MKASSATPAFPGSPRSASHEVAIWPWLLIALLVLMISLLLKFGADAAAPETSRQNTTVGEALTPASTESPAAPAPMTAAPGSAINPAPIAAVSANLPGAAPMRELPNDQLMKPGDDSAYLKDGAPGEEAGGGTD